MAIPHRVERVIGVFILLPVVALVTLVLISGSEKGWFEKKLILEATFDEGMALKTGAAVVMEGVTIGWVNSVEFDPSNKVKVTMEIRKRYAPQIRTDSVATITKLNILGEPVVVISKGSGTKPTVAGGVEIPTRATREVQPSEVRQLLLDTIDLVAQLNSDRSTIGKIARDEGQLYAELNRLLASVNRVFQNAPPVPVLLTEQSQLVLHLNMKLEKQVDSLMVMAERLDKLLSQIEGGRGTIGKLVSDPELYNTVMVLLKDSRELVADLRATVAYLKQAAPVLPSLAESGDALIRRADGLLQKVEANPILGGPPPKEEVRGPLKIEERFDHYRTETPKKEEKAPK